MGALRRLEQHGVRHVDRAQPDAGPAVERDVGADVELREGEPRHGRQAAQAEAREPERHDAEPRVAVVGVERAGRAGAAARARRARRASGRRGRRGASAPATTARRGRATAGGPSSAARGPAGRRRRGTSQRDCRQCAPRARAQEPGCWKKMCSMSAPELRVRTRAFRREPLAVLARARDAGDATWLRLGRRRLLVLSHPDLIEDALVTQARALTKEKVLWGGWSQQLVQREGPGTIGSEDWAVHTQSRRRVQPAFAPARLDGLRPDVREAALEVADSWPVEGLELWPAMRRYAITAFCVSMLGTKLDDGATAELDQPALRCARLLLTRLVCGPARAHACPPAAARARRAGECREPALAGRADRRGGARERRPARRASHRRPRPQASRLRTRSRSCSPPSTRARASSAGSAACSRPTPGSASGSPPSGRAAEGAAALDGRARG